MLTYARIALCLFTATACSVNCTLIGCYSGLTIQFTTPPTAPLHIEATSPDAGPRSFDCASNSGCIGMPLASGYLPETVTLTVTYQGRTT